MQLHFMIHNITFYGHVQKNKVYV